MSALETLVSLIARNPKGPSDPIYGPAPKIPPAYPQSTPTLKMPTARGWAPGTMPVPTQGLKVAPFAQGLDHPRWIYQLPNGDILVAESSSQTGRPRSIREWAMFQTMKRAGAARPSANRITLLRDADGDGIPEIRETFLDGLFQPFGMALVGDTFYVGNTDALVAVPYQTGQTRITAKPRKLLDIKPHHHWTRSLLASPDGSKLYIGVGSFSNIAENGFDAEIERACVLEYDIASGNHRVFAGGLRNPVGLVWEPVGGQMWTVVNERDGIGDETPPDYLTSVKDGAFYGWPYSYYGQTVDERVQPQRPDLVAKALPPDYALGGHTASLGLAWHPAGTLPGLPDGMLIGQHGSWNRSTLSGYKVIFLEFRDGMPVGRPRDILSGFLAEDEKFSNGRPVGVEVIADGSVLVADDVGDTIWRLTAA